MMSALSRKTRVCPASSALSSCIQSRGFDSISVEDLAPRFKWVGLYSQRKQNLGGEFTSTMTNTELQDKYFMLRVRFDGGVVSTEQLRKVGGDFPAVCAGHCGLHGSSKRAAALDSGRGYACDLAEAGFRWLVYSLGLRRCSAR